MENVINAEVSCHDCRKKLENKGITLVYDDDGKKIKIHKCEDCYEKNPSLTNFRTCEVYSRIVGYIRPVSQWHIGKKQEYKERKEFKGRIDSNNHSFEKSHV